MLTDITAQYPIFSYCLPSTWNSSKLFDIQTGNKHWIECDYKTAALLLEDKNYELEFFGEHSLIWLFLNRNSSVFPGIKYRYRLKPTKKKVHTYFGHETKALVEEPKDWGEVFMVSADRVVLQGKDCQLAYLMGSFKSGLVFATKKDAKEMLELIENNTKIVEREE